MKNYLKIFRILIGLLTLPLLVISCGASKESPSPRKIPLIPEILSSKISKTLISKDGLDTVESTLAYSFYSTPKFPWQDSVNYLIGDFVWQTTQSEPETYDYKPLSHQFFYERLDVFAKNYANYSKGAEYAVIWSYEGDLSLDLELKDYVQVKRTAFLYSGGAHPNSVYYSTLVSKADGKTMLLEDLVTDMKKFNLIAEKYFRAARELKPEDNLSDELWFENNVFACNDNFDITKEGITFTFNAYEIAPYVFGDTEFTVPMDEIKSLLKTELSFN